MQYIKSDIRRAFTSWGFWTAIGGMVLAILIGAMGDIVNLNKTEQGKDCKTIPTQTLLKSPSPNVMLLCVPILSAMTYTAVFVGDLKSGFLKEFLLRYGRNRYISGKEIIQALMCGLKTLVVLKA